MPRIRRAFARAMACAFVLASAPAGAQNLLSGKITTGTPTFVNDQNVPLQLDATGALKVTSGGGGAAGGSVGAAGVNGTQAQSVQGINGGVPQAVVHQGSSLAAVGITPSITQSGTAVVGKASQGNLYSAYAVNTTATAGYLACINAAAVPAAGAAIAPVDAQTLAGAVGATASINYGSGPPNAYSIGIVCLITTSLATYTAGGASFIQARVR